MAGTKAGGLKAAQTCKERHGKDFYRDIGRVGGKACVPKGFGVNAELAKLAGAKGGKISRRGKSENVKKVIRGGKEMTKIVVKKVHTPVQKVGVNYGNN